MAGQSETTNEQLLRELLVAMADGQASDLHLVPGHRPTYRRHGRLEPSDASPLRAEQIVAMTRGIAPAALLEKIDSLHDADFSMTIEHGDSTLRYRVNVFKQQRSLGVCFRLVPQDIPSLEWLGFPLDLADRLTRLRNGLILLTGITGSGKTTSLAALVQMLNGQGDRRIITVEEPIEYVFPRHDGSVISQREVGVDVPTFYDGLKFGLRQDPDVILVGEVRDRDTAQMVLSAAETGHLILTTLHTRDAKGAITRFVDLFPRDARDEVRVQLSLSLRFVVTQHLLPSAQAGERRVLVLEVLANNLAVASAIRFGKIEALETAIQTGRRDGMFTLDDHLARRAAEGRITQEIARAYAKDPDGLIA